MNSDSPISVDALNKAEYSTWLYTTELLESMHYIHPLYGRTQIGLQDMPLLIFSETSENTSIVEWLTKLDSLFNSFRQKGRALLGRDEAGDEQEGLPLFINNLKQEIRVNSLQLHEGAIRRSYIDFCVRLHSCLMVSKDVIENEWSRLKNTLQEDWSRLYTHYCAINNIKPQGQQEVTLDERVGKIIKRQDSLIYSIGWHFTLMAEQLFSTILLLDNTARPLNLEDKDVDKTLEYHIQQLPSIGNLSQKREDTKKPRDKEQLTHKQQMVLVEMLGLDNHPLLANLKPKQRGIIVGELLNRSVDDTKNMLNLETSKSASKLDWDNPYDRRYVQEFLKKNGVNLSL